MWLLATKQLNLFVVQKQESRSKKNVCYSKEELIKCVKIIVDDCYVVYHDTPSPNRDQDSHKIAIATSWIFLFYGMN